MLTIEEIKEKVRPICERYKIDRLWLFGSYARGKADEKSDVDLMYEGDFRADPRDYIRMNVELEDTLKLPVSFIPSEHDPRVRPWFWESVEEDKVLLYEK